MEENRFCPNCGQPVKPGDIFCGNCGQSLKENLHSQSQQSNAEQTAAGATRESVRMTPTPQPPKQHKVWPWLLLVAVLIVAGGGGWVAANSFSHDPVKTAASSSSSSHVKVREAGSSNAADQSSSTSSSTSSNSASSSDISSTKRQVALSSTDQEALNKEFFDWAVDRAKMGHMAVSTWYFDHGAAGRGDWYAMTPDGRVQVQDQNQPGKSKFKIHSVGGVVFFKSKDGTVGDDNDELQSGGEAGDYTTDMKMDKPVSKYLLGDNGTVYELQSGNGTSVSIGTGFGECSDNGSFDDADIKNSFMVSKDAAAQTELKLLLKQYSSHN